MKKSRQRENSKLEIAKSKEFISIDEAKEIVKEEGGFAKFGRGGFTVVGVDVDFKEEVPKKWRVVRQPKWVVEVQNLKSVGDMEAWFRARRRMLKSVYVHVGKYFDDMLSFQKIDDAIPLLEELHKGGCWKLDFVEAWQNFDIRAWSIDVALGEDELRKIEECYRDMICVHVKEVKKRKKISNK